MNVNYGNFHVDHILDLRIPTALSFLTSHRCYKAARTVTAFASDFQRAGKPFLQRAVADGSIALLALPGLKGSHNEFSELLKFVSGTPRNYIAAETGKCLNHGSQRRQ
jgi:hypothetical protein